MGRGNAAIAEAEGATTPSILAAVAPNEDRQRRIRAWKEPGYVPTSYSALSTFHYCPRQFRFSLDDRDEGGDAARMGHVLHAYKETGKLAGANELRIGVDPEFWRMIDSLDAYQTTPTMQFERELFWEVPVEFLAEGRPVRMTVQVRAFIDTYDVVDGWALVDDFKTGRMLDYDSWEQQRTLYAIVAAKNDPNIWRGVRARTIPLRFPGKEKSKGMSNQWDLTQLEREAMLLEDKLAELARAWYTQTFPARPETNRCRLCSYAHKCDAAERRLSEFKFTLPVVHRHIKRKGSKEEVVESTMGALEIEIPAHIDGEEAWRKVAASTFQLEKLLKDLKALLKERARTGSIELPEAGGAYAFWAEESQRIRDAGAAIQRCVELGIDLGEVFSFNHQTGAKYIREYEELQALTETVPSRYPKFEFRKVKEDPA